MKNFNRPNRNGDGKKFEKRGFGKRSFDSRPSGKFAMHKAMCTECGNPCEVPFKPTGSKPVFCTNCFKKGPHAGKKATEQHKEQFEILNVKIDRILKILTTLFQKSFQDETDVKKIKILKPKK